MALLLQKMMNPALRRDDTGARGIKLIFVLLTVCALTSFSPQKKSSPPQTYSVWVFLDPECPVSQSYTLTLRKIYSQYTKQGVAFRGIYPSPAIKKADIERFHRAYQLPFSGEEDPGYALARRYRATTMPEVVLINAKGEVLYRGAIDNWYYALGKNRPAPTEHYLKNALDAALGGYPIMVRQTEAIGCLINY
jgi:hypothetical protein